MPPHMEELFFGMLIFSAVTGFIGYAVGRMVGAYKAHLKGDKEKAVSKPENEYQIEMRQELLKLQEQVADIALMMDDRDRIPYQDRRAVESRDADR